MIVTIIGLVLIAIGAIYFYKNNSKKTDAALDKAESVVKNVVESAKNSIKK